MSRKALVIDDDAHLRELLRLLLELDGFEVETRRDGIDAIELEGWYDVILVDLKMPVFDGERLVDYWMMTRPQLLSRVIILSGFSRFTQGRELTGTFATVQKPFDNHELMRIVQLCAAQPRRPDSEHLPESEQHRKT
ncbi:MAG TPA: response regulator [Thermoanaerobaculia bacterium]